MCIFICHTILPRVMPSRWSRMSTGATAATTAEHRDRALSGRCSKGEGADTQPLTSQVERMGGGQQTALTEKVPTALRNGGKENRPSPRRGQGPSSTSLWIHGRLEGSSRDPECCKAKQVEFDFPSTSPRNWIPSPLCKNVRLQIMFTCHFNRGFHTTRKGFHKKVL